MSSVTQLPLPGRWHRLSQSVSHGGSCKGHAGSGQIVVNGREFKNYFARPVLQMIVNLPFDAAIREDQYDGWCTVKGGGLSGQAGAVRHGISRALLNYEPELRGVLKAGGFLTRDARVVERKKYGRAKARRSFQFSKR